MMRAVSLAIFLLSSIGLLLYFVATGDDQMSETRKKNLKITSLEPGGVVLRVYTEDTYVPPTYITCTNITPSGSFSVALNAAGEAYFGSFKDDVNAAIAAAVSEAVAEFADKAGTYCEDQCTAMLSGTKDGTSNDASASAQIVLTQGVNDDICWPGGIVPDTGIHITASAPGVAGVDLRPLIESFNTASYPAGTPSYIADAITQLVADLLAEPSLVVDASGGSASYYLAAFRGIKLDGSGITLTDFTASGSTPSPWTGVEMIYRYTDIAFSSTSIDFADGSGGDINQSVPLASWTGTFSFAPSEFSLPNSDGATPRTIDQTINLDNTGGDTDVHTPSGDSASLTASGSMTIALSAAASKLTDPGVNGPKCREDYSYTNRRGIVLDCDWRNPNMLEIWEQAPTGFKVIPGKEPVCQVPFWPDVS